MAPSPPRRLVDLNPRWCGSGGEGVTRDGAPVPHREGIALYFDCPCGCDRPCVIPFKNPLDGQPADPGYFKNGWQRTGDTFETLTLTPSILRADPDGCKWHGFLTNGVLTSC